MWNADVKQRSDAWYALRKQCVLTASEFAQAIGLGYRSRMALLKQKIDPEKEKEFQHKMDNEPAVIFGNKHEAEALDLVEAALEQPLCPGGFWVSKEDPRLGASPDAVGCGFLVEVKCPYWHQPSSASTAYRIQMEGQMAVSGISRCYFMSYVPGPRKLFCRLYERNEKAWNFIYFHLRLFMMDLVNNNVRTTSSEEKQNLTEKLSLCWLSE